MQTQWTDRYDRYPVDVWYGAGGGKWEVRIGKWDDDPTSCLQHHGPVDGPPRRTRRMKAVTWGSRGSLPATVHAGHIRSKITRALEAVQDHDLSTPEAIDTFIDAHLPFAVRGGYGTNTTCVEIRTYRDGREFLVIDCGSGLRDFGAYLMM